MVASSPIQYDDHSTVSSTAGPTQQQQQQSQSSTTMLELQSSGAVMQQPLSHDADSSPLMASPQQQQSNRSGGHFAPTSVHSPNNPQQQQQPQPQSQPQSQPVDIHAYQPPWKNLIEYANHGATPPERLNTTSPRYQQLIGQVSLRSFSLPSFAGRRDLFHHDGYPRRSLAHTHTHKRSERGLIIVADDQAALTGLSRAIRLLHSDPSAPTGSRCVLVSCFPTPHR